MKKLLIACMAILMGTTVSSAQDDFLFHCLQAKK